MSRQRSHTRNTACARPLCFQERHHLLGQVSAVSNAIVHAVILRLQKTHARSSNCIHLARSVNTCNAFIILMFCLCGPGISWRGLDTSVWILTALAATWSSTEHVHCGNLPPQKQFPRNEAMACEAGRAGQTGWSSLSAHMLYPQNAVNSCPMLPAMQPNTKLLSISLSIEIRKRHGWHRKGASSGDSAMTALLTKSSGASMNSFTALSQLGKGRSHAACKLVDKAERLQGVRLENTC